MNDENAAGLTPHREVDISVRFIRQAYEYLQHTQKRYVTFLFTGELVADATCIGISTEQSQPLLIEQSPAQSVINETSDWTIEKLTEQVILDVIHTSHPINTKRIGDRLGIAGNNTSLRQRIRRILVALAAKRLVRRGGNKSFPSFSPIRAPVEQAEPRMNVRPATSRVIHRKDITDEKVITILRLEGPIDSRSIGDRIGIPRTDNIVRSKITEIISRLRMANQVRRLGVRNGGHLYEWLETEKSMTL